MTRVVNHRISSYPQQCKRAGPREALKNASLGGLEAGKKGKVRALWALHESVLDKHYVTPAICATMLCLVTYREASLSLTFK